jgi:selenocysteine-specific elongation factor
VLSAAIEGLCASRRLASSQLGLTLAGHGPQLSRGQQQLLEQIVEWFLAAGLASPGVDECVGRAAKNRESVPKLLELAAASGQLVKVGPDYWLHPALESHAREQVRAALTNGNGLTLSEIRELLNTTRKYAVPLCEYWDKTGFTIRQGDSRTIRN